MMTIVEAANEIGWEIHQEPQHIALSWLPFIFVSQSNDSCRIPDGFRAYTIAPGAVVRHAGGTRHLIFSPAFIDGLHQGGTLFVAESPLSWLKLMRSDPGHPFVSALKSYHRAHQTWQIKSQMLDLSQPAIMGIWNVTPDSFSSGFDENAASFEHAQKLCADGADILDIGAESTRPGAVEISSQLEIARLEAPLEWASKHAKCPVSLDSRHPETIGWAAEHGYIDIINDVALNDPDEGNGPNEGARMRRIAEIANAHSIGLVIMAWQPHNAEVLSFDACLEKIIIQLAQRMDYTFNCGMNMHAIVVDPGIGFGKGPDNDYRLIFEAPAMLALLGRPVLIAHSRKRCLARFTSGNPHEIDLCTAIATAMTLKHGAAIVRVHTPSDAVIARSLVSAFRSSPC